MMLLRVATIQHLKYHKHMYDKPHVNLVERGEHGGRVLSLLEPLGNAQAHGRHADLVQ